MRAIFSVFRILRLSLPLFFVILVLIFGCSALPNAKKPPTITPCIIRTIPHDTAAFTQGLIYHRGKIYESTGLYGHSSLRVIDPHDGRVDTIIPVAERFFGEGLALFGDLLYQLTWRECEALLYSADNLQRRGRYRYRGEGWGLTSDGTHLIMSNGSDTLSFMSSTMEVIRRTAVTLGGHPVKNLNELEFANGSIYANVWYRDVIYRIDPATGAVTQLIDCAALVRKAAPASTDHVLNGIAFHKDAGVFFLTGKKWPLIFEVTL